MFFLQEASDFDIDSENGTGEVELEDGAEYEEEEESNDIGLFAAAPAAASEAGAVQLDHAAVAADGTAEGFENEPMDVTDHLEVNEETCHCFGDDVLADSGCSGRVIAAGPPCDSWSAMSVQLEEGEGGEQEIKDAYPEIPATSTPFPEMIPSEPAQADALRKAHHLEMSEDGTVEVISDTECCDSSAIPSHAVSVGIQCNCFSLCFEVRQQLGWKSPSLKT